MGMQQSMACGTHHRAALLRLVVDPSEYRRHTSSRPPSFWHRSSWIRAISMRSRTFNRAEATGNQSARERSADYAINKSAPRGLLALVVCELVNLRYSKPAFKESKIRKFLPEMTSPWCNKCDYYKFPRVIMLNPDFCQRLIEDNFMTRPLLIFFAMRNRARIRSKMPFPAPAALTSSIIQSEPALAKA